FELFTGDSIMYTDKAGAYIFGGPLVETHSKRNLTAERVDERNMIDFSKLPLEKAIKTVKGTGERKLAIFADPDCPFCKRLEKEIEPMTNVTIYTFLYPLLSLHPDAERKARVIWCSKDRSNAWSEWMLRATLDDSPACEDAPISEVTAIARDLEINSTPTLF